MQRDSVRAYWLIVALAVQVGTPGSLFAEDKNGVAPNTISRPSGPGSLEGLGAAFQPFLNTGTATYAVDLALPSGVAGFTPGLSLRYDGGNGASELGIGWSLSTASIKRQSDKGLPRYDQTDRYVGMDNEELVPLKNGYALAKIEGSFIRYRQISDHWKAQTKSGTRLEFGLTDSGRLSDATQSSVSEWCLERQTDTHGNVIEYTYARPFESDRLNYLTEIRYGPGAPPWGDYYRAVLSYETRPDPFSDCRSGFKVITRQRLSRVDVFFGDQLIRRYELGYLAGSHWSLLSSIQQFGTDAGSPNATSLPATTFDYAITPMDQAGTPLSAANAVIRSVGEPATVMDGTQTELIDLNADGLPDLLDTSSGSTHVAYLNRGVIDTPQGPTVSWAPGQDVGAVDSQVLNRQLSAENVHLADMTGDGIADLVSSVAGELQYFCNTGEIGWGPANTMSTQSGMPPSPFGPGSEYVRTADLDFDKRIDILRFDGGLYQVWFNRDGTTYESSLTDGAQYGGQAIDLSVPGVDLADVNGDRISDVVWVQTAGVVVSLGLGFGEFEPGTFISFCDGDPLLDPNEIARSKWSDVNGDGLSDLAIERFGQDDQLRFWLNLGEGQLAPSRLVTGLPATGTAQVRWADLNGNGTTDVIYADSSLQESKIQFVDLGRLILGQGGSANALTSIDNGYGRTTLIHYRSSTEYAMDAAAAGLHWTTALPFPVQVVSSTETTIGLDLDGYPDEGPNGDTYKTDFSYRDGYYDPIEKQFRGFSFVKQIEHGDERFGGDKAPTLVTRYGFHTGAPDGYDNDGDGQTDEADLYAGREEEPLKGVELWRELTILPDDLSNDGAFAPDNQTFERHETPLNPTEAGWSIRNLCTATGGALATSLGAITGDLTGYQTDDDYNRDVRQSVRRKVTSTIIELGVGTARALQEETDTDVFGNTILTFKRGDLSNPDDDLWEATEYALDANAEASWIVNRVSRVRQKSGGPAGTFVSETRNYYDGAPFVGLAPGAIGIRGDLHRTEALVSDGTAPLLTDRSFILGDPRNPAGLVDMLRQQLDAFGNPTTLRDARGNDRIIGYDAVMHTFPTSEQIVIGGGSDDLNIIATYDYRWGKPLTLSDFNGHDSHFHYDNFGRLTEEYLPLDPDGEPTRSYQYNLGAPFSSIVATAHPREGGLPGQPPLDVVTTQYFDGLGRKLGMREDGGNVMREVTLYNPRGNPCKVYQPYHGNANNAGTWTLPPANDPAYTSKYDAKGRATETITPPDEFAVTATMTKVYEPLRVIEFDGEDNRVGSPHFNTPKTLVFDGLERLIEVHEIETLSGVDNGTFITRYRYAMPDLLAEIEDANSNIKYMRYDGLGRKIFMNDLNRGHMTYTYDAASNLIRTLDAKLQEIVYGYDGANRLLTEDYLDIGHPLSLNRSPDVIYHYDVASSDYPSMPNLKGRLSYVEDLTGAEFFGYNYRGQQEQSIKRIDQMDGSTKDYLTTTLIDNLDRVFQIVYPDGGVVRQAFDARGLLAEIPNFAPALTYEPSGQPGIVGFENGVITMRQYDPRLRLQSLYTENASNEVFQDLTYIYDQADNITNINDGRSLPMGEEARSQTASYLMDNLYHLRQADGAGYGIINYDYDRLGNMAIKSSAIADPDVNIGAMISGQYLAGGAGQSGTSGRIGREIGDAPGPHALTSTSNECCAGADTRSFDYDANGNMIDNNGDLYVFDFKDRLGDVDVAGQPTPDIRYLYDYADRRVIKRVDAEQTSYINRYNEIRDGEMIKYVWNGDQRLVKVRGDMPAAPTATQRLYLKTGWNAISFQVDPGSTDLATILADIDGSYDAIYGYDGTQYLEYLPGGMSNTLTQVLPNQGYWLFMNADAVLELEGPVNTDPVLLNAGWNFVGIPGLGVTTASVLLAQNPEIDRVWVTTDGGDSWQVAGQELPRGVSGLGLVANNRTVWVRAASLASITPGTVTADEDQYLHINHLGSTNFVTDGNGARVTETLNFPFGSLRYRYGLELGTLGCEYQFTGKERDIESGLQYFEARYFDASLCRFISADRFFDNLQATNQHRVIRARGALAPYSYSSNNPLNRVDPDGQFDIKVVAIGAVTAVGGAIAVAAAIGAAPVVAAVGIVGGAAAATLGTGVALAGAFTKPGSSGSKGLLKGLSIGTSFATPLGLVGGIVDSFRGDGDFTFAQLGGAVHNLHGGVTSLATIGPKAIDKTTSLLEIGESFMAYKDIFDGTKGIIEGSRSLLNQYGKPTQEPAKALDDQGREIIGTFRDKKTGEVGVFGDTTFEGTTITAE